MGMKINNELMAGTYQNTLIFTAVADMAPIFSGITTMQEMNRAICDAEWTPEVGDTFIPEATLTDTRDGSTYTVRKLTDGNCWMTQNLRLGKTGETYYLSAANSDLPTGVTYTLEEPATGTWSDAPNDSHVVASGDTSKGNYYSWPTAVAGTATYGTTGTDDATGTICPKGWTLPSASGDQSWANLMTTYGYVTEAGVAEKFQKAPVSLVRAGYYNNGASLTGSGTTGSYWSKTNVEATKATSLTLRYNEVTSGSSTKINGGSIRCLVK